MAHGVEIVATGQMMDDGRLVLCQSIKFGNREGVIEIVRPILGGAELRIVIQLSARPRNGLNVVR